MTNETETQVEREQELIEYVQRTKKNLTNGFLDSHNIFYAFPTFVRRCNNPKDRLNNRGNPPMAWQLGGLAGLLCVGAELFCIGNSSKGEIGMALINSTNASSLVYETGKYAVGKIRDYLSGGQR